MVFDPSGMNRSMQKKLVIPTALCKTSQVKLPIYSFRHGVKRYFCPDKGENDYADRLFKSL